MFIGVSFVLKKKGLLAANLKDGKEAGEGYGYLKNAWWWSGMILSLFCPSFFPSPPSFYFEGRRRISGDGAFGLIGAFFGGG